MHKWTLNYPIESAIQVFWQMCGGGQGEALCPWIGSANVQGRRREGSGSYSGPFPLAAGTVGYGEDRG
jgi:hypothetical protein